MAGHVAKEQVNWLNRLRRLRGQVEALERAVDAGQECSNVLHQATSCRGALDGFIAEIIEDHIHDRMIAGEAKPSDRRTVAAEEMIEIVHAYLRK